MIPVLKANREKEPFSEEKILQSIKRAGVPEKIQEYVLDHIKKKLYPGISTNEIYQHILEFLDKSDEPYSRARYSLKESIMMLGPTGYPFEDFIARLFEMQGYNALVRQTLMGKCVSHEVDIVIEKEGRKAIIEAKFHNHPGTRSEVQVALYTKARFDDVKDKNHIDEAWIVTNTKTTVDANTYAQCMNMHVMSWSYPEGKSLRDYVEQLHLYPITILTSLNQNNKMTLLTNHVVLCRDIKENPQHLDILPLSKEEKEKVKSEIDYLCKRTA